MTILNIKEHSDFIKLMPGFTNLKQWMFDLINVDFDRLLVMLTSVYHVYVMNSVSI